MPARTLTPRSRLAVWTAALLGLVLLATGPDAYVAAQTPTGQKWIAKTVPEKAEASAKLKGEQGIVVLVNDEPVTSYQIEQRARFLALGAAPSGPEFKAKAEARWAQIIQDPKTSARFQDLLREKKVQSREEAQALQKTFLTGLQQEMLEQLRREGRASAVPKVKGEAKEELIEERLKLQAAKKLGIEVSDAEVARLLTDVAQRNNMTLEQFRAHLKTSGVDISTMAEKFRADKAWRDLIGRRYAVQVSVTQRDVDRVLSSTAAAAGADAIELQVHRISLALPSQTDQSALIRRYAEAEGLRRNFAGCKSTSELVKGTAGAKFQDMNFVKPSTIAEPTRSMLLSAKDGDMLPPLTTATGVEIYAVCGRRALAADDEQRSKALRELQSKELDVLARTHMRNLRQEADIEHR
jgi:peptidyl-prolyl cis-trans isomerase SurA